MATPSALRAALGYARRLVTYRSFQTAGIVHRNRAQVALPLRPAKSGRIACEALGLTFDPIEQEYVLQGLPRLARLARVARFENDANGCPIFVSGTIRVAVDNAEVIGILDEIFYDGVYDLAMGRDALVLDVGHNVGIAALFFAGKKGWEVVGYEPFAETFAAARRNVEASGLSHRIDSRNAAVSDHEGSQKLRFDPVRKGRNSLFEEAFGEETPSVQEVGIVDAADVLREARAKAGERALVVKLDCEGAEYPILERLAAEGLLGTIDVIVLEHHPFVPGREARDLERILVDSGFVVHTSHAIPGRIGMMWAARAS